jgi:hypothetical protein
VDLVVLHQGGNQPRIVAVLAHPVVLLAPAGASAI